MALESCLREAIVLKAVPLRMGASRKGAMKNPVVRLRVLSVPLTPSGLRVSSQCHPGLEQASY
jgi:hypothetical protein